VAEDYIIFLSFYSKLTFFFLSLRMAFRVSNSISFGLFGEFFPRLVLPRRFAKGRKRKKGSPVRLLCASERETSGRKFSKEKGAFCLFLEIFVLISLSFQY
jgi:hypothetical protein